MNPVKQLSFAFLSIKRKLISLALIVGIVAISIPLLAFAAQRFTLSEREKALNELGIIKVRIENEKMFWGQADNKEQEAMKLLDAARKDKDGSQNAAKGLRMQAKTMLDRHAIPCEEVFTKESGVCDFTSGK